MADNSRTETARDHDDSDLIEGMMPKGDSVIGSSGGNLARDVGTDADLTRAVDDPEALDRVTKQDDINHGQRQPADRGPSR